MTVPMVVEQAEWVLPAKSGAVCVITIDSTSREYDLFGAALGVPSGAGHDGEYFYISIAADGCDIYYTMSDASGKTVDDTAAMAASSAAIVFTANACDIVFQNSKEQIYICRTTHRYLQMKAASGKSGKARIRLSSCLRPSATESNTG